MTLSTRPGRLAATTVAALALTLTAGPAFAQKLTLDDPAGDAVRKGLDITAVTARNGDHKVVVKVTFDRARRGDLIVSVDPRGGSGVRLISLHRPQGTDRDFVLPGAFSDFSGRTGPALGRDETDGRLPCPGYRVRWAEDRPVARVVLPSSCLADGDYGAVRVAVLTERGSDADYAPENKRAVSAWIPRG